jgi:hypothetical protein
VFQYIIFTKCGYFLIDNVMTNDSDTTDTKQVVDFAERLRYVLELKINKLRIAMQKSNTPLEGDMLMIRIQALEWVQGRIHDLILNNVTRDWPEKVD